MGGHRTHFCAHADDRRLQPRGHSSCVSDWRLDHQYHHPDDELLWSDPAFAMRYDKKLGIGTLISMMIPYSMAYLLGWVVLFYTWVFVFGLPVGPGTPTFYP